MNISYKQSKIDTKSVQRNPKFRVWFLKSRSWFYKKLSQGPKTLIIIFETIIAKSYNSGLTRVRFPREIAFYQIQVRCCLITSHVAQSRGLLQYVMSDTPNKMPPDLEKSAKRMMVGSKRNNQTKTEIIYKTLNSFCQ